MNLNEWAFAIQYAGSKKGKDKIRKIVIDKCLSSDKKVMGAYQISPQKIWEELIINDPACIKVCKEKKINDIHCLEYQFEAYKYHAIWNDNRHAYSFANSKKV